MNQNRNLMIGILVLGIAILGVGIYSVVTKSSSEIVLVRQTNTGSVVSKQIIIPANQEWFDTGVDVTGKRVSIQYVSGRWSNTNDSNNIWTDGMGSGSWPGVMVPNAPIRSLVGKTNGRTFFVGNHQEGDLGSGRLYLSMNEVPGTFNDNLGSLEVIITTQ